MRGCQRNKRGVSVKRCGQPRHRGQLEIKARETEKGIALLSRSAGTVRVDTSISAVDAGDVIRDFRESSKLDSRVTLKFSDSFDALPDEVRKAAENAGGRKDNTYAVLHKGRLHLESNAKAHWRGVFMPILGRVPASLCLAFPFRYRRWLSRWSFCSFCLIQ